MEKRQSGNRIAERFLSIPMKSKEELLTKFKAFESKVKYLESHNFGSDFLSKIVRVFIGAVKYGTKYIYYILARAGIVRNRDVRAELFWGKDVTVPLSDNDSAILYYLGGLSGLEYRLIKYILGNLKKDDVFYDVGANYGFYTYLAQELVDRGQIHVFEPQKDICQYVINNTKDCPNCFISKLALSDISGKINLFVSDNYSGGNTIIEGIAASQFNEMKKTEVDAVTLDSYTKTHKTPTFMKIDVEGAEYKVLSGGQNTLKNNSPAISIEIWRDDPGRKFSQMAVDFLLDLGYKPYKLDEYGKPTPIGYNLFDAMESGYGLENFLFLKGK